LCYACFFELQLFSFYNYSFSFRAKRLVISIASILPFQAGIFKQISQAQIKINIGMDFMN